MKLSKDAWDYYQATSNPRIGALSSGTSAEVNRILGTGPRGGATNRSAADVLVRRWQELVDIRIEVWVEAYELDNILFENPDIEEFFDTLESGGRHMAAGWAETHLREFQAGYIIEKIHPINLKARLKLFSLMKKKELEQKSRKNVSSAQKEETEQQPPLVTRDPKKVFVVSGRNEDARRALFRFLRSIKLDPQEWTEWVHENGHPSPYTGDVLKTGFGAAQAFVVLMTPDDEARLRERWRGAHEESYETELTPQPRSNVIYEAGMAMGVDERRTVLVQMGKLRPMSDILGRHVIRIDDTHQKRKALAQRLELAGCPVKLTGDDWMSEGEFDKALEGL